MVRSLVKLLATNKLSPVSGQGRGHVVRSLVKLLAHPGIWVTAVRVGWRLGVVPDRGYLRFRMVTMYGDARARPRGDDLLAYLRWCRAWERSR